MTSLRPVLDQEDLQIVHQLAHRIWWPTYRTINCTMTSLKPVLDQQELQIVHQLAHRIWWPTYRDYLDPLQIETMLADMYSVEALTQQQQAGVSFALWMLDEVPAGFVGY